MAIRKALDDSTMEFVSGGITYSNYNHPDYYTCGKNNCEATHTFKASDFDSVIDIIKSTVNVNLSADKNEENIMNALISSGLLTPIA